MAEFSFNISRVDLEAKVASLLSENERLKKSFLPGSCRILSIGAACDCTLCKQMRENVRLTKELAEAKRKRDQLQIPLCIGRETIQRLAETGKAEFSDHAPLVAADSLIDQDPYAALARSQAELAEALHAARTLHPVANSVGDMVVVIGYKIHELEAAVDQTDDLCEQIHFQNDRNRAMYVRVEAELAAAQDALVHTTAELSRAQAAVKRLTELVQDIAGDGGQAHCDCNECRGYRVRRIEPRIAAALAGVEQGHDAVNGPLRKLAEDLLDGMAGVEQPATIKQQTVIAEPMAVVEPEQPAEPISESPNRRPWLTEATADAEGWDQYGYWESWVERYIPEYVLEDWQNVDSTLKANLYAICAKLADGAPLD